MSFSRNVFILLRGTAFAHAITLIALPLLSRLYAPEAFGALQVMQSILTVLLVISCLRLEVAIMSASEQELPILVTSCLLLSLTTTVLVLIVSSLWLGFSSEYSPAFSALLYVLPFSLLATSCGHVFWYVALRNRLFGVSANAKVMQALTFSASSAGLAFPLPSALGLAIADCIGRTVYFLTLLRSGGYSVICLPRQLTKGAIASLWAAHRSLPLISLPGALINALGSAYTPVILLLIFTAQEAGQYAMVERTLVAPVAMIASTVSQVFMSQFAEAGRTAQSSRRDMVRSVLLSQLRLGILPAALIFFLAPSVFPFVLGDAWTEAGLYAQVLTPLVLVSFVVGPVNMALTIAGHQTEQLMWDVGRLVVTGLAWLVAYWTEIEALHALWLYCGAACLSYLGYLWILDATLDRSTRLAAIRSDSAP